MGGRPIAGGVVVSGILGTWTQGHVCASGTWPPAGLGAFCFLSSGSSHSQGMEVPSLSVCLPLSPGVGE